MMLDAKWSLSFLALSITGIAACTITSGTVDDTGLRDSGPDAVVELDAATTPACPGNLQGAAADGGIAAVPLGNSQTCQRCMEANCCSSLTSCFNKTAATADDGTCDDITACVENCLRGVTSDKANCRSGCDTAFPRYEAEYKAIASCRNTSCSTLCPALDL